MKQPRRYVCAVWVHAFLSTALVAQLSHPVPEGQVSYSEKDGIIAIEAETYTARRLSADPMFTELDWSRGDSIPGYGGAGYLLINHEPYHPVPNFNQGLPMVSYTITVENAGTYYPVIRGLATRGGNSTDSYFFIPRGFMTPDTASTAQPRKLSWWGSDDQVGLWMWSYCEDGRPSSVYSYDIQAGEVTMELYMREAGSVVDQVLLVRDLAPFADIANDPYAGDAVKPVVIDNALPNPAWEPPVDPTGEPDIGVVPFVLRGLRTKGRPVTMQRFDARGAVVPPSRTGPVAPRGFAIERRARYARPVIR